jgi:hypothetical protein
VIEAWMNQPDEIGSAPDSQSHHSDSTRRSAAK